MATGPVPARMASIASRSWDEVTVTVGVPPAGCSSGVGDGCGDSAPEGGSAAAGSAGDRAAEDRAAEDRAAEDRAAEDRAAEDRAAEDRTAGDDGAAGVSGPEPS